MQGLLSQYCAIIPLNIDSDINNSTDSDSIDMKGWDHCCMIYSHSAAVTGDNVFYVYGGATDGAKTAALTFNYRYGGATVGVSNADVLAAPTTSAALTLTAATYQGRVLVIEIDAADMQSGGTQYRYLTANFDGTATVGTVSGFAVLTRGRFIKDIIATVIG